MMQSEVKMTVPTPSVEAAGIQSLIRTTRPEMADDGLEADSLEKNRQEEMQHQRQRMTDPHYLHTISMTELPIRYNKDKDRNRITIRKTKISRLYFGSFSTPNSRQISCAKNGMSH